MSDARETRKSWYVVHNAAGNDKRALDLLNRSSFEVYYPAVATMRLVPKNKLSQKQRRSMIPFYTRILTPFFPRYFFVHFDLARGDWHDIFAMAGVHGILFTDDSPKPLPAPVPDRVIAGIQACEIDGAIPAATRTQEFAYRIGDRVKITDGPLAGHNAVVDKLPKCCLADLDECSRLELLVSLFGRKTLVEIALSDIEKL
jgi:transcription antitermination factor NusG